MPGATDAREDQGMLTYLVPASVDEVTKFYRAEMAKTDWQLGASGGNATTIQSILAYRRPNSGLLIIGINPRGDGSIVAISVR